VSAAADPGLPGCVDAGRIRRGDAGAPLYRGRDGAMISLSITVDDDIIVAYQELFRDLPKLSQRAFRGEITRVTRPMLDELTATPGPPQYPIRWKSERQRRAFFATNGFGRGIPTQRTGAIQEAWSVEVQGSQFDIDILVDNDLPYAQ